MNADYLIWESPAFFVLAEREPLVDREDGGHIVITPRNRIPDRQALTATQAIEFMRLTMVVGEAMAAVMTRHGVNMGRINYQDNGNWSVFKPGGPYFHLHLYGRATTARTQKYGQTLNFPHRDEYPEQYRDLKPLSRHDVSELNKEIGILFQDARYADGEWGL